MSGLRQRRPRRGGGAGWVLWAILGVGMLVALTSGVLTSRLHLTTSSAHSDAGTSTSLRAAAASNPGFAHFTLAPADTRVETLHIAPALVMVPQVRWFTPAKLETLVASTRMHVLIFPPAQMLPHTDGERDGVGVWLSFFCADPPLCTSSSAHTAGARIATAGSHPHGSSTRR